MLVSWNFSKQSLWVDEKSFQLFWNGDLVVETAIQNNELACHFGDTWQAFLQEGDIEAIYAKNNDALKRSLLIQAKGKGKGKVHHVFGINPEDY